MSLEKVVVPSENQTKGDLQLYYKGSADQKMGVIVVQEWWGVNEQIKQQAVSWFAADFQIAIPDLYRGKVTESREEADHEFSHLDWTGAVKDIQAAMKYLQTKCCTKVGVTGFCMGGALSLAAASVEPQLAASAPFYGIPDAGYFDVTKIKCPVQGHFGNADTMKGFTDPEAVNALEKRLKEGRVHFELFRYDGAGHAFCNSYTHNNPDNVKAMNGSKQRVIEFFKIQLT